MKKIKQKGMSLLEVVVAMLVVGIALSGSLAMIQAANRFGLSAEFISIGQQHAQSMIDRIRANQFEMAKTETNGDKKAYVMSDLKFTDAQLQSLQDRTITGANAREALYSSIQTAANAYKKTSESCANATKCESHEIAANDISFQLKLLLQELPQGTMAIGKQSDNGVERPGKYVVIVMWKSASETPSPASSESGSTSEPKLNTYGIAIPFSI